MKIGIKVGDIMTRNFISVKPDTKVTKCAQEMKKKKVGSLIIIEKNKLVGLLTSEGILDAIVNKKDLSIIEAKDIMDRKIPTIKPDKDMYEALVIMKRKRVRWLPVTVKDSVSGMLTIKDILRIEPTLFDTVAEISEIKEEREKMGVEGVKKLKERRALASGETWIREGECAGCGAYGVLFNVDGELLCEECKDEKEG